MDDSEQGGFMTGTEVLGRGLDTGLSTPTSVSSVQGLSVGAASRLLGVGVRGLSTDEAARRLARYGPNDLPAPRRRPLWLRFAAQLTDLFAVVLIVAALVTFGAYLLQNPRDLGNLELAIAIVCVVLLNAVIGFYQEYSAERTAQALQQMVPHTCRVLRDGVRQDVQGSTLVPGDLVVLEAGDAVPADCRVIDAHSFAVNTAALTGESAPAGRTADPVDARVPLLDAKNLIFMGTVVTSGSGRAVVVSTGLATQFGRIFSLTLEAPVQKTPLQRQVAVMARRVSAAAIGLGALVFVARLPAGQPLVASFVFALGVMVALVPEGLPATLSVSLAVGVRRMATQHALVKRLLAVEALGSTTVICTDKTGTLTQAEMTVTQVWTPSGVHEVTGIGYEPVGTVANPDEVRELLRMAALCSNARLVPPANDGGWRVLGDTTEGALLVAAVKAGVDLDAVGRQNPRVMEFPFDSNRKLMTTVHSVGSAYRAYVKGAPQELLARCTHVDRGSAGVQGLDADSRAAVIEQNDAMARPGLRVLAVAYREVSGADTSQDDAEAGLVLSGLVGMLDPPRPEVTDAVRACHAAGIRIIMVTGDHALTAEAVARRVGIVRDPLPTVRTGTELDLMTDAELAELLRGQTELLFCRVSPEHKMRVVATLQDCDEVVAVTGDGANDAPALKRADIGVAMGQSGTDVAREAALMVLLDDSFAAIVAAVRLGRSVYQNIRKFLIYLFSHNVAELAPILVATFVGFPLVPLSAVQVLAIDLGSDVLPALALGAEPPEPDVMDQPPRRRSEALFSAPLVRRFLLLGAIQSVGVCVAFFWRIHTAHVPFSQITAANPTYREAITMTQAGIVISQFFNGFTVRSDRYSVFRIGVLSNRRLVAAECFGLAIVSAISYVPPLQAVFHTAPLSVTDWAMLVGFGLTLLFADEARKWFFYGRHERNERALMRDADARSGSDR